MIACPSCGAENPDGFKFCGSCGAELAAAEAGREVRKVVTIVFCDLTGSTALGDRTDPEALRATMRRYYEEMRTILERHGGTVEKFVGDAVMAVFGVPVAHEDDALRAVRAAWEMRDAVPKLGLVARIGVNTGEVVAGEGDTLVTGDAVNVAARLEQGAEPGDVLVGAQTQRLVRGAARVEPVDITAKGKSATVSAFRLVEFDVGAEAFTRRLDAPLVGRSRELAVLRHAFERATGEESCHLFTLLGAAGVGKSRLVQELLGEVDATVLAGRCLDYGEGITYWPVVEVLKQLGAGGDAALDVVVEGASSTNDLFWAVRAALEEAARERPVVVVFDDVHWGEATFLDLVDHVADLSRGAPILLLCVARPELLDHRPGWAGGKLNATTVLLEPLSADESAQLVSKLDGDVDAATRTRILETAGGNPLFLEEMLALAREGGDVRVPATIHALLQARLDQLQPHERVVLERGAVEGQVFHRGAVSELVPEAQRGEVTAHLDGLVRKELIRPEPAPTFAGDDAFRFRHLLFRDAAYDALPKEARADLHERFATWLEHRGGLIELDEVAGYHLEQAARYLRELGRDADALAARAGQRLADAGQKAHARHDVAGATKLLERALALLPEGDAARLEATLVLAEASVAAGEFDRHDELLAPLLASTDQRARDNARVLATTSLFHRDASRAFAEAEALRDEVVPRLERAGDLRGLARASMVEFWIHWMGSRAEPALVALRRAIALAQRTNDRRLGGEAMMLLGAAVAFGPTPASQMEEVAAETQREGDYGTATTQTLLAIAVFRAVYAGDFDRAREVYAELNELLTQLGSEVFRHAITVVRGELELFAGRPGAAVEVVDAAAERLLELGVTSYASTLIAIAARALLALGRLDEAERRALRSEELSVAEDVINFALSRGVRARVYAARGDLDAAHTLALEAVQFAFRTDFPVYRGEALVDLAYVLRAAGRRDGARDALERALAEYTHKGFEPMIEKTKRLLVEL